MEATTQSHVYINLAKPICFSSFPSQTFFHSKNSNSASHSCTSQFFKISPAKQHLVQLKARHLRKLRPVNASNAESPYTENSERWLLEFVGDGDSRHIGFRVPMPGAFEIASSVVTVGRLPQKADIVIPVGTVSGLHARIEKKEGSLLITDLDSTNGTFIDDKRLTPGAVSMVSPGNCITFGDTHLAMFRVSKLENKDLPSKPEESEIKIDTDAPTDNPETAS